MNYDQFLHSKIVTAPERAIFKYPGSKWRIADRIISKFPKHHSYLEPFFGSGAVLFKKPRSPIETVNDLDCDVVNLFEWMRTDPERLAAEIALIPYARSVFDRAFEERELISDSFQRAVNFYIRMMMGYGFRTNGEKTGWKKDVQGREAAYAARNWCQIPEILIPAAERLRGVQIECRPALDVIRKFNYPNVLIYADPPYVLETRCRRQYRHEMTDSDHELLLDALLKHRGPVILSGYDSPMYSDALRHWNKECIVSRNQACRETNEILWMNF